MHFNQFDFKREMNKVKAARFDDEFILGQQDFNRGVHQDGKSNAYERGYKTQTDRFNLKNLDIWRYK